jgi:hypothetical protein
MKNFSNFVIVLLAMASWASAAQIHVAPNGNDANPGTADKPVASLEKARDMARAQKGSTVLLAAGTYCRVNTFELDDRDSGTIYKGQAGTRITGGVAIPDAAVKPVTDPAILDRLLPEVRGRILEIDLKALGISDFGEIGPRGFTRPYIPSPLELFVDDEPLRISQWPNPGEPGVPIGKVLDKGPVPRNGDKPTRGGIFQFATDRPGRWARAADLWITGLFNYGYADDTVKVKSID